MEILDRILFKINAWLNKPKMWGICLGCGRRYEYHRGTARTRRPGYCSFTCMEQEDWKRG